VTSRIAVIGDVHGNAPALSAALAASGDADTLVLLGDLLSYGPDVDPVVAQVEEAVASRDVVLLRGNHDALYERGDPLDRPSWPRWIHESVDYVFGQLDIDRFRRLPWRDRHRAHSILFAHANPFGDWTYVNSPTDHARAATVLTTNGDRVGVFGHTHRPRCYHYSDGVYRLHAAPAGLQASWESTRQHAIVLNAGSIGQPRDATAAVYVLWLTVDAGGCSAEFEEISYDRDAHIDALRRLPVSVETRERLIEFHLFV
jgi:predicted phosphodiesterase